jgi:hypothetical protein
MDAFYPYLGQEGNDIPRDVIQVRVDPSVEAIKDKAFNHRNRRRTVDLSISDGLENIGKEAFFRCTSP